MLFKISLAGVTVKINSIYDEVYYLCEDYLTDDNAALTIDITMEDIEFERKKAIREVMLEKHLTSTFPFPYPDSRDSVSMLDNTPFKSIFPDSYLETLAVYRQIAVKILTHDSFLMHGSAVAVGREAFLFTAPSGTGKTTHTRLWLENIPGSYVVNGDKPLIRVKDDGCEVCGTPWSGKETMNTNVIVPLRAICILGRDLKNHIEEMPFLEAYQFVFAQSYRPTNGPEVKKTMELIRKMGESVRFYRLSCNMEPEAAQVAACALMANSAYV